MRKHPEYMILIAVGVALVASIICTVAAYSAVQSAIQSAASEAEGYNSIIEEIEGGQDPQDLIDELLGGNNGGNGGNGGSGRDEGSSGSQGNGSEGDSGSGSSGSGTYGTYTEEDVPAAMDIDIPELTDDLQACITRELQLYTGDTGASVTLSDMTKDDMAKPELKNGWILSQVKGTATITTSDGKSESMDFTSYYYADDPHAEKITWYIYAYDLGSYSLFPDGFERDSGDPVYMRSLIQDGVASGINAFGRDNRNNSTDA